MFTSILCCFRCAKVDVVTTSRDPIGENYCCEVVVATAALIRNVSFLSPFSVLFVSPTTWPYSTNSFSGNREGLEGGHTCHKERYPHPCVAARRKGSIAPASAVINESVAWSGNRLRVRAFVLCAEPKMYTLVGEVLLCASYTSTCVFRVRSNSGGFRTETTVVVADAPRRKERVRGFHP